MKTSFQKLASCCILYLDQGSDNISCDDIKSWNSEDILLSQLLNGFKSKGLQTNISLEEESSLKMPLKSIVDAYETTDFESWLLVTVENNGLLLILWWIINHLSRN